MKPLPSMSASAAAAEREREKERMRQKRENQERETGECASVGMMESVEVPFCDELLDGRADELEPPGHKLLLETALEQVELLELELL